MLLPLVVAALGLAQTPPPSRSVAVIPSSTADLGKRIEQHLRTALTAAEVPLANTQSVRPQDALGCENNRRCFALLGRVLGTFAVMRVEAVQVGSEVAVLVEALESETARVIREESFAIPISSVDNELPLRLSPLVAKVLSSLPPPQPDKPLVVALDGAPAPDPRPDLTHPAAQAPSAVPIWLTGSGAVVFAGASAALLAVGVSARSCLNGPPVMGNPTVCVPQTQANGVQRQADIGLVTGIAAGAVAIGLTVTAIIQYATSK